MLINRPLPKEWTQGAGDIEGIRTPITSLIEALRNELTDYGGMLVLLEEQQQLIELRSATALIENVAALKQQMEIVATNRKVRNRVAQRLLEALDLEKRTSFNELIPLLPIEYQPLLRALIDEINDLLFRCQQRVLLNSLLLTSAGKHSTLPDLAEMAAAVDF